MPYLILHTQCYQKLPHESKTTRVASPQHSQRRETKWVRRTLATLEAKKCRKKLMKKNWAAEKLNPFVLGETFFESRRETTEILPKLDVLSLLSTNDDVNELGITSAFLTSDREKNRPK